MHSFGISEEFYQKQQRPTMNYKYDEELKGVTKEMRIASIKYGLFFLLFELAIVALCTTMFILYGLDYDDFRTKREEFRVQILVWLVGYGSLYILFLSRRIIILI